MLSLSGFNAMMENAWAEMAPHKVCAFIYDLANKFNTFYHDNNILNAEESVRDNLVDLIGMTELVNT